MKTNILKVAAALFAAAVSGSLGCMGSGGGGGCGGGNSVPATTQSLTCGKGTHQANGQCVANSSSGSSSSSGGNTPTQAPTSNTQSIQR